MLESFNTLNKFEYQRIPVEEQQRRGILGRLAGIIADSKNPTRNGRHYTEELWDKVFSNPIMQEKIENRVCLGELGHPADRQEVDIEKVAICLAEQPKKGSDGKIYGVFDILSTPNGKILKSLCDYGCNIGVSSRGSGDTYPDADGNEAVDPDTYDCQCWDAVLLPAVKEARLSLVNESLDTKKSLQESLYELVNSSSDEDKKIMSETLENLNIGYKQETVNNIEESLKDNAVDNNEAILNDLQEALKQKQELENKVIELQEKLSVCYAKESKTQEEISKYKKAIVRLSEKCNQVTALQEKVEKLNESLEDANRKALMFKASAKINFKDSSELKESVSNKDSEIAALKCDIKKHEQMSAELTSSYDGQIRSLNEQISSLQKDAELKKSDYASKLEKANSLTEKYKKIANKAVGKYIDSQAVRLGVTSNEIKNRLPESYNFSDIDKVCEDLISYRLGVSKLPFQTQNLKEDIHMKITPSRRESILPATRLEDEIDEQLKLLAGIN